MRKRSMSVWLGVAVVGAWASMPLRAEEAAAPANADEIKQRMETLQTQRREVEQKLGEFRRTLEKDEAVAAARTASEAARKASEDARRAYEDLLKTKLTAIPDAAPLVKQWDEIRAKMTEMEKQMRAAGRPDRQVEREGAREEKKQ